MPTPRRQLLTLAVDVGLFAVAFLVLRRVLRDYRYEDLVAAANQLGGGPFLASLLVAAAGYAALVGYDYLSLRLVGHPLPLRRMAVPSFISFAVANSAPIAIVTGGGLRYRLFSGLGLTPAQTARVTLANVVTFVLGLFTVSGAAFLVAPVTVPPGVWFPLTSLRVLGIVFLVVVLAAFLLALSGPREIGFRKWRFELPPLRRLLAQVGVSSADWLLSSGALYVLLRAAGPAPYLHFLAAFLLAQIVTQVMPLPGGIGVFEAVVVLLRPAAIPVPAVAAALLLYRVSYYLVPLLAAAALLAWRVPPVPDRDGTGRTIGELLRAVTPHLLAVLTFLTGAWLLLFGALPADPGRMAWLGRLLPLAVIEGSHFMGSLVGTALLLLGWGLQRQVQGAWRLTLFLVGLGIPAALLRAGDIRSAGMLVVLALALLATRHQFGRRTPLGLEPLDAAWNVAALLAVAGVTALALFAHGHREYAGSLWWRFALEGDAPRALRMVVGVVATAACFVLAHIVALARTRAPARHAGAS